MNETTEPVHTNHVELAALELRVRRLEDAFAQVQDLQQLEQRLVERFQLPQPEPPRSTTSLVLDAARHLIAPEPVPPPPTLVAPVPRPYHVEHPWFLTDLLTEARVIVRMFVDPRYRLGWQTRLGAFVLIVAIFTSTLWIPGMVLLQGWFLGTLVDKVVDLLLAFVLFKLLGREARRYRETAPDLPANLRL